MPEESTDARNKRAKDIVARLIQDALKTPMTPAEKRGLTEEFEILERLIPVKANGFRGVVLTGIVGMFLDSKYKPTEDFYRCNPRSIFEQGIYYALVDARIPCGKSDPLNVAKNIQKLDYNWAQGKRPEDAARAAVDYLSAVENAWPDSARRYLVIRAFFSRLVEYAAQADRPISALSRSYGQVPIDVANRLAAFALECPEGGAIPQFIVGSLIRHLRANDRYYSSVEGVEDSVFGTNTTSKKPADIWEVLTDGTIGQLYEITAKKIDLKRLDDCADALTNIGLPKCTVTFICHLPRSIDTLGINGNFVTHKGVIFQFIDIRSFIIDTFLIIGANAQTALINEVRAFVSEVNRAIKTKDYWNNTFLTETASADV